MIIKCIEVNLQYEALHNWKLCPLEEVKFLRDDHRHIFHITVRKKVSHNDRDIEIIMFKKAIESYLYDKYHNYLGSMSCEMLAEELINEFELTYAKVLEDGENGAVLINE